MIRQFSLIIELEPRRGCCRYRGVSDLREIIHKKTMLVTKLKENEKNPSKYEKLWSSLQEKRSRTMRVTRKKRDWPGPDPPSSVKVIGRAASRGRGRAGQTKAAVPCGRCRGDGNECGC